MRLPPKWLLKLQPGEYDLQQLMKITKKTRTTVRTVMLNHGADVKKVNSGYRNLSKIILIWRGWVPPYEVCERDTEIGHPSISEVEFTQKCDEIPI